MFGVFDDNGDGFIDCTELQSVLGDGFDEIKKMIEEVDKNNDGVLSLAEFKDAMKENIAIETFKKCFEKGGGYNDNEQKKDK